MFVFRDTMVIQTMAFVNHAIATNLEQRTPNVTATLANVYVRKNTLVEPVGNVRMVSETSRLVVANVAVIKLAPKETFAMQIRASAIAGLESPDSFVIPVSLFILDFP